MTIVAAGCSWEDLHLPVAAALRLVMLSVAKFIRKSSGHSLRLVWVGGWV